MDGLVAPLAGSVDRNLSGAAKEVVNTLVAPLAGSVDRNHVEQKGDKHEHQRRSPRGERG